MKNCSVVPHEYGNTSDHLPIMLQMSIKLYSSGSSSSQKHCKNTHMVKPNWSSSEKIAKYKEQLSNKLCKLELWKNCKNCTNIPVQEWVDMQFDSINNVIHESCAEAGLVPRTSLRPKAFWCPDLARLRDSKRFWWSIWTKADRPRSGILFSIYKDLKKKFRRTCRRYINGLESKHVTTANHHFRNHNMSAFWNMLKKSNFKHIDSSLSPDDFAHFYSSIMQDKEADLSDIHQNIKMLVEQRAKDYKGRQPVMITSGQVRRMIKGLKTGTAAGHDGITTEHLIHGLSDNLCNLLGDLYSTILSNQIIPQVIKIGVIIPILKKPTLDANKPENFRPITLSSIHSKLVETILKPDYVSHDNQYGFTENRGTSFVTNLVHDVAAYLNDAGSPLYLCTLDAEKCFDRIWHDGLFFKLQHVLPTHYWHYLLKWYRSSLALVRWSSSSSYEFAISRGMKQGSLLSPVLFKIFLDDLMSQLHEVQYGVRISDLKLNSCTYADDITVLSSTITGLQCLIDVCTSYAEMWRMKFSEQKSKCIIIGKSITKNTPSWKLYDHVLLPSKEVEILGVTLDVNLSSTGHVDKRASLCRRTVYRLSTAGMCYPGLEAGAKVHIWNTVGAPTLQYGMEGIHLSAKNTQTLSSCQTTIIKSVMGFSKRSHHTSLLRALSVPSFHEYRDLATRRLFNRVMSSDTPAGAFQTRLLARYTATGHLVKNTLLQRIISRGHDPYHLISHAGSISVAHKGLDGLADTLHHLVYHHNFIKPWSEEYTFARLLLQAF